MQVLVGVAVTLLAAWVCLVVALWWRRPPQATIRESLRILPDTLRMLRRIASDPDVPRGARVRLWLLLAYLLFPLDLVPDFIPVVGYADDVVIAAIAVRSAVRRAGADSLETHWPGTRDGLAAVRRLARC